jgi:tetratricopeptide (TPR) repeat protein
LKEEANAVAERLVRAFPRSVEAIATAARVYDQNGNTDEALKCWQQCLRLDPRQAQVHSAIGYIALRKGEYETAAARCREALRLQPDAPGVHNRLAHALMGLGQMQEAAAALQESLKLAPGESRSYYLLGQTYMHLNEYEKARASYATAIELNSREIDAYYGMANACARLQRADESRAFREQFAQLKSEYWQSHVDLRSRYDDVAAMRGALARTYTAAGEIYMRHRLRYDAEGLWRKAAQLDPNDTQCRVLLSTMYQSASRLEDARQVCEELTRIEPDSAMHLLNLGSLNARLRRADAANSAFRRAKELTQAAVKQSPTAANYYLLCIACDRTGDPAQALEAIQRAVQLDPGNQQYEKVLALLQNRKTKN